MTLSSAQDSAICQVQRTQQKSQLCASGFLPIAYAIYGRGVRSCLTTCKRGPRCLGGTQTPCYSLQNKILPPLARIQIFTITASASV